MPKKDRDTEKIVMRHILEVRLSKRLFSFLDFKGEMIDFFADKFEAPQMKLYANGVRFDLASDDLAKLYFFSHENFGFQIDASQSFDSFRSFVNTFIEALKTFPKYKWTGEVVRLGTKSSILYHRKGDSFESLKQSYKDMVLKDYQRIAELTKSDIVDTAHIFDLKVSTGNANVLTGPVTKEKAIHKFYGGQEKLYKDTFDKNNGLMFSIDVANTEPLKLQDLDALKEQINKQINDIETVFNGFKTQFAVE